MEHYRGSMHNENDEKFDESVLEYLGPPAVQNKQPLSFQITRHATSCYNIKAFSSYFKSDGMPSLAKYGIDKTIELATKHTKLNRFRASVVCVSNLIRTWMTAVLLYAFTTVDSNTPKKEITFYICPHLREDGRIGNGAYPLTKSIPKFIDFLNNIKSKENYTALEKIHLLIPKSTAEPHTWVKITITIPKREFARINIVNNELFCSKTKVIDNINGYKNIGNISEFMAWFTKSFPNERGTVHVVAHSHIMKDYFNEICKDHKINGNKFDIKKHTVSGPDEIKNIGIDAQNCWTFTTGVGVDPRVLIKSIQHGYANPDKMGTSAGEPPTEEKGSLCRKDVEEIICLKKGGYHTKKNRKKSRRMSLRL